MALSAVLFYTNKIYPKDIVLDKNTIPDDPNERLKDKVFMSVVFTVKHFCEYKDFVVPETTFKDDLKCTKEQMEKILKSLSDKFNIEFDKHWFGTVKDLTIYVKDHKPGKSEESVTTDSSESTPKYVYIHMDEMDKKQGKAIYETFKAPETNSFQVFTSPGGVRNNLKKSSYVAKSLKYILCIPTALIKDHLVKENGKWYIRPKKTLTIDLKRCKVIDL